MSEKIKAAQFGVLWVALLEDLEMSANGKLLYGVMWSFGSEARATVGSYARRCGFGERAVKVAQKELAAKGWITLVAEGKGTEPGKGCPRTWEMTMPEGGQIRPPQKVEGYSSDPPQKCTPIIEVPIIEKTSTGPMPEPKIPANKAIVSFLQQRALQPDYKGQSYKVSGKDAGALGKLLKGNYITEIEWLCAMGNYWFHEEKYTGRHSLACLCNNFSMYCTNSNEKKGRLAL